MTHLTSDLHRQLGRPCALELTKVEYRWPCPGSGQAGMRSRVVLCNAPFVKCCRCSCFLFCWDLVLVLLFSASHGTLPLGFSSPSSQAVTCDVAVALLAAVLSGCLRPCLSSERSSVGFPCCRPLISGTICDSTCASLVETVHLEPL